MSNISRFVLGEVGFSEICGEVSSLGFAGGEIAKVIFDSLYDGWERNISLRTSISLPPALC